MKVNSQKKFQTKAVLFIALTLILSFTCNAQTWQWGKRGGGVFGNNTPESISDMATDKNGNVYVVGLIESSGSPTVDGNSLSTYGGIDIVVASFSCNGMYRWSKVIGGGSDDNVKRPNYIGTDTLGHVYVVVNTINYPAPNNVRFSTDSTQPSNSVKNMTLIQYDTLAHIAALTTAGVKIITSNVKASCNSGVFYGEYS